MGKKIKTDYKKKHTSFNSILTKYLIINPNYSNKLNYNNAKVGPSKYPQRKFCKICQLESIYNCKVCLTSLCSVQCKSTHNLEKCNEIIKKKVN